jgi:hypothetical protein
VGLDAIQLDARIATRVGVDSNLLLPNIDAEILDRLRA